MKEKSAGYVHSKVDKELRKARIRKWTIGGLLALVAAAFIASMILSPFFGPMARKRVIEALEQRFDSDVELKNLSVSLLPLRASGEGLVLRRRGSSDLPPLISVGKFSASTGITDIMRNPRRVRSVYVEGLQIHVPPRRDGEKGLTAKSEKPAKKDKSGPALAVQEIVARGTVLKIIPKKEGKQPLTFEISELTLQSVGSGEPMRFDATLSNPKPPGKIETKGEFGPWRTDEPSLTPLSGNYTFKDADLSVFKGIAGILSSEGKYGGVLERIEVQGTTDVPDFSVRTSGHPVHLKTDFKAVVNGTDGDTYLEPVNAHFLNSKIVARGAVAGKPGQKGKTVALDISVDEARIEDMLRLAVKSDKPLMTGQINFKAKFELPPGDRDVVEKLNLNGQFGIGSAKFTEFKVQDKVEALSRRASGKVNEESSESVASNFKGRFNLENSLMSFSNLSFAVPGANVQLNGNYGLTSGKIDFSGSVRMQAKISEMTTGVKSFFLKAVDPLFKRKGAGAVIPIKIGGTREEPSFGLDVGRTVGLKK